MQKHLVELTDLLKKKELYGDINKEISDISADSRNIQRGAMFIALRGNMVDGHKFVDEAVRLGASAVVVDTLPAKLPDGVAVVFVPDTRTAMEIMTPAFYDYPGRKLHMIGVTGTNGKTTTACLVRNCLKHAGYKVGMIGTISVMIGEETIVSRNTTPDVVDLQKFLFAMVQAECEYCVMEVSSHAIVLNRIAGIEFECCALTNITQDHLDFHKTMKNYREAKAELFSSMRDGVKTGCTAVLNMDDPSAEYVRNRTKAECLTYGKSNVYDIYPVKTEITVNGLRSDIVTPGGVLHLKTKITGEFNLYNLMAATGILLAEGIEVQTIEEEFNEFSGVAGRFQKVETGQKFTVIVDYAHTPDGLENVLKTARQITTNKLWIVFGCGGDRDAAKRPIMGEIAGRMADNVVITSDNPRTEDPEKILDQIETGLKCATCHIINRIADRRKAIEFCLGSAVAGDVVLIAGKGHEDYQILKDRTIHFDDTEVVKEFLKNV